MTRSRRRSHIKRAKVLRDRFENPWGASGMSSWSGRRPMGAPTERWGHNVRKAAQMAQAMRGYYHD